MKTTPTTYRSGFTLIELSIVLVIIGLLLGGMLGMRAFLKNSEISSTMNEAKYYISAFNQFQTRYNAAPGDYSTAGAAWSEASGHDGDGNGLIRSATSLNPLERYYVFQHLALAGFIQGTYTGATNGGTDKAAIGINVPGAPMDKVAFFFDHPDATDGNVLAADTTYFPTSSAGMYGNVLWIAGLNDPDAAASTQLPTLAFLTPKQALQLDEKNDDGQPGTGSVMVPESSGPALAPNPNCYTSSTVYDVATNPDTKACPLILRIQ